MSKTELADWEKVLSAASHLQEIVPDAILVGGTAAVIYAEHRISTDADHVVSDLRERFDVVLADLESVAGWKTARVKRPVEILGSLDGIETGVRQLIRAQPLETTCLERHGKTVTIPTLAEILRIKAVLILKRNATRDYIDFVALADRLNEEQIVKALMRFDELYPQPSGESALQQLQIQLGNPMPYDLDVSGLSEYKHLSPQWQDWAAVETKAAWVAMLIFKKLAIAG